MNNIKKGKRLGKFDRNLSINQIYVGEVDTTIELRMGGKSVSDDFYHSYYIRNENDLSDFIGGKKCFVYGQKGTGKTAFLRYVDEKLRRENITKNHTILYSFLEDFPDQAHREITEFAIQLKSDHSKKVGREINIFRDIDYEDFWIYIIMHSVAKYIQSNSVPLVANDEELMKFKFILSNIEKGSIQERLLRLIPKMTNLKIQVSGSPSISADLAFGSGAREFSQFSDHVQKIREQFFKLNWLSNRIYFMFDEIDPRVGSGKAFDLDCILIRDLITVIYRLNAGVNKDRRCVFFSAAIRSEVLRSIDKLGKEVHKNLTQLGIHMNWGHYGQLDANHPLVSMLCKKILYSERRAGRFKPLGENPNLAIWRKYFRTESNAPIDVKDVFRVTWLKPRDIVRLFNICKEINGDSKIISDRIMQNARALYSNQSWNEIQSQLNTSLDSSSIEALDIVMTRFFDEFTVWDLNKRIDELSVVHSKVESLKSQRKIGDIVDIMYVYGIIGNRIGDIHRFYYRGDETPQLSDPFVLHAGLRKKFSTQRRRPRTTEIMQPELNLR